MTAASPKCGIYTIRNAVTGRAYIGSSRDCIRRFGEHRSRLKRGVHSNAKLQASWNKHGADAFEFEMLCCVLSPDDLERVEQEFLDSHDAVRVGYNLAPTAGNTAGWKATPETRARMSAAAKARDNSLQVEAMNKAIRGRKRPLEETTAIWATRRARGNDRPDDTTRAKMAQSARARSRYTEIDRLQMVILRMGGHTTRAIGTMFGLPHQNVVKYTKDWLSENRS